MLIFAVLIVFALLAIAWTVMTPGRFPKIAGPLITLFLVVSALYAAWPRLVYLILPYDLRPERINYIVETVDDSQFEFLAKHLVEKMADSTDAILASKGIRSPEIKSGMSHIDRFRKAGIRSYEGPATCQKCHETVHFRDQAGKWQEEDLRKNLTRTSHFTFAPMTGFSTFGFNGQQVENFPLGKMDRACGVTGTFTWTGWAVQVKAKNGETYSEGCGQCHIGGQYGPVSTAMMPLYRAIDEEWEATDCLVCHSREYDMNLRLVVIDKNGKGRWEHDRRFIAAMSVGRPTDNECLRCHQHNLGGDTYLPNPALEGMGRERPRLAHPGAKRGTPYGADWDVHAAAQMECLDCHVSEGHRIARGIKGVDLVANDLPDVEISCEKCHTATPHKAGDNADIYNVHVETIACETCHIKQLHPDNLVFRDWSKTKFNEEHGIYTASNGNFEGAPGKGIVYKWFNGNGTFMANALGDNPNGLKLYRAINLAPNKDWKGWESFDYAAEYEKRFRPIANASPSKIWPFKRFQAIMYEDLHNQGPYGGMILPIDYNVYYGTGDAVAAVKTALERPIMRMMYQPMFKYYLMDRFMAYMAVPGWDMNFDINAIAPREMRNEGNLMINHAIQKTGRSCAECHSPEGILDFDFLGYPPERAAELRQPMM